MSQPVANVVLQRFLRRAEEGMQKPPVFEADDETEWVLKLDQEDPDFPVAELIGASIAPFFGVQTPAYAVATVPAELTDALAELGGEQASFAQSFRRRDLAVFASRWLEPAMKWRQRDARAVADWEDALLRIFVFDAYIENGDRSAPHNPNILIHRGAVYAIDHGQALPSVQGIERPMRYGYDSHLAWPVFERHRDQVRELAELARDLPDSAIDDACGRVPPSWWGSEDRQDLVRRALRARRSTLYNRLLELCDQ